MRVEFHSRWLRIIVELFPRPLILQRYTYLGADAAAIARRRLLSRTRHRLRRGEFLS